MAEWTCAVRGDRVFLEYPSFAARLNRASECNEDKAVIEVVTLCCRVAVAGTFARGGTWCPECGAENLYPNLPASKVFRLDEQGQETLDDLISYLTDPLTGAIWAPVLRRFGRSTTSFTSWVRDARRRPAGLFILAAHARLNGLAFLEVPDGK